MTDRLTIFLLLDAFRWDYINPVDTPVLSRLTKKGLYVRKLRSSSGFTQRSSIFTGTWPETSGNFTMHVYNPACSPYAYLKYFPFLTLVEYRLPPVDIAIRKTIAWLQRKMYPDINYVPGYIPYDVLPRIGVSEDAVPIQLPGALAPLESIFDRMAQSGIPYEFLMFPAINGDDRLVIDRILGSRLRRGIILAQFSDSDGKIHVTGEGKPGAKSVIRDIDNRIGRIMERFSRLPDVEWVIIGDHGMTNVTFRLDIRSVIDSKLKTAGLKHGRDYLIFLSSTLAHFWWFTEQAARDGQKYLRQDPFRKTGFILDSVMKKRFHIPTDTRKYGDTVWCANKGILIYPDYFHRYEAYKAMHGYITTDDDMKGFACVYNSRISYRTELDLRDLIDICPTICDSIGIPYPADNRGQSLFNSLQKPRIHVQ